MIYTVRWEGSLPAESPEDAVRIVNEWMREGLDWTFAVKEQGEDAEWVAVNVSDIKQLKDDKANT